MRKSRKKRELKAPRKLLRKASNNKKKRKKSQKMKKLFPALTSTSTRH